MGDVVNLRSARKSKLPRLYREVWELPRRPRKWLTASVLVLAATLSALLMGALGAFLDGP